MALEKGIFNRTELLLGTDAMECIGNKKVLVVGVGGVGSWCAESLVRSGIAHLTIVDSDLVCITNINRQLMATMQTVGHVKVDVLKERLLAINPNADINAIQEIYNEETADKFDLDSFDYVIDAIDSLKDKALLILNACKADTRLFSSMGAALKMDPTRIQVAEFWKVKGDPLAAALRRRFKKSATFPKRKFKCVFSDELLHNQCIDKSYDTSHCMCPKTKDNSGDPELQSQGCCTSKAQINGTLAHVTAIFGFYIAGLVIGDIMSHLKETQTGTATTA